MKIKERRRARFYAIQALYQKQISETTIPELKLQFYQDNTGRHLVEWNFFYRLIDGVGEKKIFLDKKINQFSMNSIDSISLIDLSILRLGAYELIDCLEIPYQVIISEYTEYGKEFGTDRCYRFINGLLERLVFNLRH